MIHRLQFTAKEKPLIAQIWGTKPENYLKAAVTLKDLGFAGIDINMGCPVSKIVKNGACSGLIQYPSLAAEIIQATREGSGGLPVSVKTRLGFKTKTTEKWCGFLLEQKLPALIVHGRVASQLSKFPADWTEIARVVEMRNQTSPDTLIIGNGDVKSLTEVEEKAALYGVDGVMIGRGIFENPFLFNRTANLHINNLTPEERFELLFKHADLYMQTWQGQKPFNILKKYFKIYIAAFPGAADLRQALMLANNLDEVRQIYHQWSPPADLRHSEEAQAV